MPFTNKRTSSGKTKTVTEIPVFCKIWEEDGVFNAVAEDLPIAVFGKTHEEAQKNLGDAILTHLEALMELRKLDEAIEHLRFEARSRSLCLQELPREESFFRFSAAVHDKEIFALV